MADTLDILTLTEAKTALNLTTATHDTELAQWVTAISRRIDDLCGPVVVRAVTETHQGGRHFVVPYQQPVSSMTTVTEYNATSPTVLAAEVFPGTITTNDYAVVDGIVYRRMSGYDSVFAGRVIITYQAGRYATTAAADAKFKLAAASILRRLWAREAGAWARGGDPFANEDTGVGFFKVVDPMINEFLGSELKPRVIA